mmetsp:Transcript_10864/g.26626  ORF Transcript_10864/g.26626 Transcript_10864/m.26626 type:complete len:795 (-) Transcript_10864:300-2684(-)
MGCGSSRDSGNPPIMVGDYLPNYDDAKGPFYVMTEDAEAKIIFAKKGPGSADSKEGGIAPTTVIDLLNKAAAKHGDKIAMRVERIKDEKTGKMITPPFEKKDGKISAPPAMADEKWQTWTYAQYKAQSDMGARALMAMGVEQFGTVGIYGFNSPEWFLAEICTICAGAKTAGIYPSDRVENVVFKLKHSKANVIILEDESKLSRLEPYEVNGEKINPMDELPNLKYVVTWAAGEGSPKTLKGQHGEIPVLNWEEFMKMGEKTTEDALKERQSKIKAGHCAALIYTSGTTGRPKAVMISHDNIHFDAAIVMNGLVTAGVGAGGQERSISYLPLSHVAGMMVDIIAPLFITASTNGYHTISFARPYDLKIGTLGDRLRAVKPTIFLGVPRVWEKVADKLKAVGKTLSGVAKTLSNFSKPKLLAYNKGRSLNGTPTAPFGLSLAKIYAKKVQTKLGLEELKFGVTSAAPIQTHTLEFYGSLGIVIKEVYGMSECGGATTLSLDQFHIWGSVGYPIPGVQVAILAEGKDGKYVEVPRAKDIFNAEEEEQGEICYRGRHIMMGYLANPDFKEDGGTEWAKKKNESAIDENGWLHSGDKGCMDSRGMIKITGRYKELIIGAGGENVAPVPIEGNVKKLQPAISNIMMVGDKRKYNVALVTLKVVGATGEEAGTNELLEPAKLVDDIKTVEDAMNNKEYVQKIWEAIDATNKDPNVCPKQAAMIRRFTILPTDFSVAGKELTATLKLKRSVVSKMYAEAIDKIYAAKLEKTEAYVNCFGQVQSDRPKDMEIDPKDVEIDPN